MTNSLFNHETLHHKALAHETLTHKALNRETRDYNSSAILAIFRLAKRQPWKQVASRTWNVVKQFLQLTLIAGTLGSLLSPMAAHAAATHAVDAEIPFEFTVGHQSFPAGHYQLVYNGPGVVTLRDARYNAVASFFARTISNGSAVPATKLVFNKQDEQPQLDQIWIEDAQILEVLGNQVARRHSPAKDQPTAVGSLTEKHQGLGLK